LSHQGEQREEEQEHLQPGSHRLPANHWDQLTEMKPDKAKSTERIDGVVGMVMGIGRAMVQPEAQTVSGALIII